MLHLLFSFILSFSLWNFAQAAPSQEYPPTLTQRDAPALSTACGELVRDPDVNLFEASLVYDCLTSVPFNKAVATKFLKYYRDSIKFQSTLAYLKTPPPSYQQPPVDLIGGLDIIQGQIDSDQFDNQYEFEAALQALVFAAHDSHLNLAAGILGVVSFGTDYTLACVSKDGKALPEIYLAEHIKRSQSGTGLGEAFPITRINGEDPVTYLTRYAAKNAIGGLESHADWNQLFTGPALDVQGIYNIWEGAGTFYPGETLTLEFADGEILGPTPWQGIFVGDPDTGPLETGGDFYNSFVLGFYPASYDEDAAEELAAEEEAEEEQAIESEDIPPFGTWDNDAYPRRPDVAQDDFGAYGQGSLSGYFLVEDSIAVLSIPSFQEMGRQVNSFSATVAKFIASSKKKGLKKIVIDLQQNHGGDALLAFDTFKQFFPDSKKEPFGGSRLRAHEPANVLGQTITNYWNALTEDHPYYYYLFPNEWVASLKIDAGTGQNFSSWTQFYGPHQNNGDSFTTTQRYDLANYLFSTISLGAYDDGFQIYGYGQRPADVQQEYGANDIVILTDGLCSSTCALFLEMMQHDGGVKTVVAGGRPSYGPMQAAGLCRGARAYDVELRLDRDIEIAQYILQHNDLPSDFLPNRTNALDIEITYAGVNLRDQVREGEELPLQFKYEAADCRIFYTPKTVFNYPALWKYAADATWTNPSLCVKDSTGYSTTNSTRTELPPADILPLKSEIQSPPVALGTVINKIFIAGTSSGDQGIEAVDDTKRDRKDYTGVKCKVGTACPSARFFCYADYTACDGETLISRPGCVRFCNRNYIGYECDDGLSYCARQPDNPNTVKLENKVGNGICKTYTTSTCRFQPPVDLAGQPSELFRRDLGL